MELKPKGRKARRKQPPQGLPSIPDSYRCPYHGSRLKLVEQSPQGNRGRLQCACGYGFGVVLMPVQGGGLEWRR